jgi:ammonium transporter Rh
MSTIEVFFYAMNANILDVIFKTNDAGGSMKIHVFGAFFGLAATLFYKNKAAIEDKKAMDNGNYLSDLVSMVGTLFLFCYWPSFNSVLRNGSGMQRAMMNTYLSLICSVLAAIFISTIVRRGKLDMEIILNASLVGGACMGCCADMIATPFGAMIMGFISGICASLGYGLL